MHQFSPSPIAISDDSSCIAARNSLRVSALYAQGSAQRADSPSLLCCDPGLSPAAPAAQGPLVCCRSGSTGPIPARALLTSRYTPQFRLVAAALSCATFTHSARALVSTAESVRQPPFRTALTPSFGYARGICSLYFLPWQLFSFVPFGSPTILQRRHARPVSPFSVRCCTAALAPPTCVPMLSRSSLSSPSRCNVCHGLLSLAAVLACTWQRL